MAENELDEVFIIFFKNHENELYGNRVMKVCLTEDIANRELKKYRSSDNRPNVEYHILPYDIVVT